MEVLEARRSAGPLRRFLCTRLISQLGSEDMRGIAA